MTNYEYIGEELELFKNCRNWKRYLFQSLFQNLEGDLNCVEVGSGIGSNSTYIINKSESYIGIEPDRKLVNVASSLYPNTRFYVGLVDELSSLNENFNAILYIDVLEHIEDDVSEIIKAWSFLPDKGKLLINVPAHQFLFSNFDSSVGHFRRYSRREILKKISGLGPSAKIQKIQYLDSIGFFLSFASKIFLSQSQKINLQKVRTWDRLISVSKWIDLFTLNRMGKSLVVVVEKNSV